MAHYRRHFDPIGINGTYKNRFESLLRWAREGYRVHVYIWAKREELRGYFLNYKPDARLYSLDVQGKTFFYGPSRTMTRTLHGLFGTLSGDSNV